MNLCGRVPHIGNIPSEKCPRIPPIRAVVVLNLANRAIAATKIAGILVAPAGQLARVVKAYSDKAA